MLSKIRSYVSHALFRDVHWVIPPAKKTSKPTTVLLGWHAWGQTRHLQQQISSLPLSLTQVWTFTSQKEMGGK